MKITNEYISDFTIQSAQKHPAETQPEAFLDHLEVKKTLAKQDKLNAPAKDELKEAFTNFVGQTLFGQMMKSMRSTVGKPAYFHGGRTEEVFQSQLDNLMTEELTKASADSYANPMFELFQLNRQ